MTKNKQLTGIFANLISNKEFVSRICKEFLQLNREEANNPTREWAKVLNRNFIKEDIWIANHSET